VFANFTEEEQTLPGNLLRLHSLGKKFENLINGESLPLDDLILEPYRFLCLVADTSKS
jgi:hypothetical protein